jgi:hypothetical protein
MKINLNSIPSSSFYKKEGKICGVEAILITPKDMGVEWTQENKIFRSSIWSKEGYLLSASFPKFTNFGENEKHFPTPSLDDDDYELIDKVDGSTFIVDSIDGRINIRSRGTFDANVLDNGKDFFECLNKYKNIVNALSKYPNHTLLFEIVSPNNKIIIDYGQEVDLYFTGMINKEDYSLVNNNTLDEIAKEYGFKRPKRYDFRGRDILNIVHEIKGIEGFCLYKGQGIWKIKNKDYLKLHKLKNDLASFNKVADVCLDVVFNNGQYSFLEYEDLYNYFKDTYDYEIAETIKNDLILIYSNIDKTNNYIAMCEGIVKIVKSLPSRKLQAQEILKSELDHPLMFTLLDNKVVDKTLFRKIFNKIID